MQNNDCIHNFGSWKKIKNTIVDCEELGLESRAYFKECYQRKCKECGFVETRENISAKLKSKKGKNKHLGLKIKQTN